MPDNNERSIMDFPPGSFGHKNAEIRRELARLATEEHLPETDNTQQTIATGEQL